MVHSQVFINENSNEKIRKNENDNLFLYIFTKINSKLIKRIYN